MTAVTNSSGAEPERAIDSVEPEYRDVSKAAILALVLGVLSGLAMASAMLWFLPELAIVTSLAALVGIQRSGGALAGRGLAQSGLFLSVLFGTAAFVQFRETQRAYERRAETVALAWFQALAKGQPQLAHQIRLPANTRARTQDNEELWTFYRNVADRQKELRQFVGEKLVRTLLALDGQAKVQLYQNNGIAQDSNRLSVAQTYAVTYPADGQPRTFFVDMVLERQSQNNNKKAEWRVADYRGGVNPDR